MHTTHTYTSSVSFLRRQGLTSSVIRNKGCYVSNNLQEAQYRSKMYEYEQKTLKFQVDISLGVKRQGREANHSSPSSAEVKE
jgi:hypothetical protein